MATFHHSETASPHFSNSLSNLTKLTNYLFIFTIKKVACVCLLLRRSSQAEGDKANQAQDKVT